MDPGCFCSPCRHLAALLDAEGIRGGRHYLVPLHADIQVRARKLGLDCLMPILWHKIANGATEVQGNGAGFYGKPYQPGGIIKNDIEYILFLRKGGEYRSAHGL